LLFIASWRKFLQNVLAKVHNSIQNLKKVLDFSTLILIFNFTFLGYICSQETQKKVCDHISKGGDHHP
jgi:hypothetical protein